MHNEEKYPAADKFDGHRFVSNSPTTLQNVQSSNGNMRGTTFTDASEIFQSGNMAPKPGKSYIHMKIINLTSKNVNTKITASIDDMHRLSSK